MQVAAQIEQLKQVEQDLVFNHGHWSAWTPERVELLTLGWAAGKSAGKLAEELGHITRSAVIGKIHRLGLPGRETKIGYVNVGNRTPRIRQAKKIHLRVSKKNGSKPILVDEVFLDYLPSSDDTVIPIERRKTILQLSKNTCRWPIGDPKDADFFYCGAEPLAGHPYCTTHCRRAFAPIRDQRSGKFYLPKWSTSVPTASP